MKPVTFSQTDLKILLIEDNVDHAELVIRSLEEHQFPSRVEHIPDGASALEYLRNIQNPVPEYRHEIPDLILLDLKLPKVNGHELLAFLKKNPLLKKIPVVILTTSNAHQDLSRAYENHVNSYLVKPIAFAEFSHLLKDLGIYWLGRNSYSS